MSLFLRRCLSLSLLLLVGLPSYAANNALSVTFEGSTVTAIGAVPGARVLFVGVALEPQGFYSKTSEWTQVVTDTARTGAATLQLDHRVPWKSIWVVADLTSNRYVIVAPQKFPIRRAAAPADAFRRSAGSQVDSIQDRRSFVNALYIDPSGGAWLLDARDGYDSDADTRVDGVTTISLSKMKGLTDSAQLPHEFLPSGTLFLIDPMQLDIVELRLDSSLLAGAR